MRWNVRYNVVDVSQNQNGSSELTHYGVPGMKWGVRKDRTKPSYGERRTVRKLKGAYRSAIKGVQQRTQMADADRLALANAEKNYENKQKKGRGVFKSTREKRNIEVQNAELLIQRKLKAMEEAAYKQNRSLDILADREKELKSYVDSLNEKYGSLNVKQLQMRNRNISAGKQFEITNTYKTGIRAQDLPIIGKRIVGKQLAEWEKEYRRNDMEAEAEKRKRSVYQ